MKNVGRAFKLLKVAVPIARRASSAQPNSADMRGFIELFREGIVIFLEHVRDSGLGQEERYLLLATQRSDAPFYARCVFLDGDAEVYWDCRSNFLWQEESELRNLFPSIEIEAKLGEMGFRNDAKTETYYRFGELPQDGSLDVVAETLLMSFHMVCGARFNSTVYWYTPTIEDPHSMPSKAGMFEPLLGPTSPR